MSTARPATWLDGSEVASARFTRLARQPKEPQREPWVQTNTEFHRDWTADQNRGEQLRWKAGVSVGEQPKHHYAAKVVVRRRIRWKLWLGIVAFGIALAVADQIISSW